MAIPFRIVAYAADGSTATNAARAAFARISELNRILSDYDAESELNHLSLTAGSGAVVPLSPELATVLLRAQHVAAASDGAFDVTVGPLTQLWRRARRQHALPDPELLNPARAAVGWTNLQLIRPGKAHSPVTASLTTPKMRLDLGGIAKGYALDEATRILHDAGLTRTLITGAGDMVAGDPPPGESGWKIELAPLDLPGSPPALTVRLHNGSLCTSGDLFQHVEINGVRYSHIVDPHTGMGLTDHSLVVVLGQDGMTTDALSTAISVLGPERGIRLAEKYRAEARILRAPGGRIEMRATRRFPRASEAGRTKAP
jgi:thiamine biosynthesis lipoprotein